MSAYKDVEPVNGPKRFSFTLKELKYLRAPDWIDVWNRSEWAAGLQEFQKYLEDIIKTKIWTPWPIISFCIGAVQAPIPEDQMSDMEKVIRQSLAQNFNSSIPKVVVRLFLFPGSDPEHQGQAVAQVICEISLGAEETGIKMWVDALREEELTDENIYDIKSNINRRS